MERTDTTPRNPEPSLLEAHTVAVEVLMDLAQNADLDTVRFRAAETLIHNTESFPHDQDWPE